jgi:DNA-binding transcriptional LysR family regulator
MSSSDGANESSDAARRRRRRSNTLLLVLAVGFLVFGAAAGALYYALQPVTLRIAVGPSGSDDHKVIVAASGAFVSESRTVRLSLITTDGAVEALALLGAGKADLAVARGDLEMPADAQTVAIVRKNVVVLWAPSGLRIRAPKGNPRRKYSRSPISQAAGSA